MNHNDSVGVVNVFSQSSESPGIPAGLLAHARILYMRFDCNDSAERGLKPLIHAGVMCRSRLQIKSGQAYMGFFFGGK